MRTIALNPATTSGFFTLPLGLLSTILMTLSTLTALSPIDGRYRRLSEPLTPFFSEFGLIRYRVQVEIEYFIALCELPIPQLSALDATLYSKLRSLYENFSETDALRVKEIEATLNHDVKAVEYFIKEKLHQLPIRPHLEFVHFGLTSQDINNTAIPLLLHEATQTVLRPAFREVLKKIEAQSRAWADVPMLARTHGQPASPTRLGKEWQVFAERLRQQLKSWKAVPFAAKFGGATGNFNAHHVAYPHIDWPAFADYFLSHELGLSRSHFTTQIEHYDHLAAYCDAVRRLSTILIDFSRDVWTYVSMDYFKQKINADEVGSSAMPHKVNPIDFENAEGNFGIANALLEHLSAKLPISRLQRDLTDSTVLRNLGVPLAHVLIGLKSLLRGMDKLELHEARIQHDLRDNWAVVAEGIQTVLRREGYPQPYEALKALTRTNEKITEKSMSFFIENLDVTEEIKRELRKITPFSYVGVTEALRPETEAGDE